MTTGPALGQTTAGGGVLLERDRELESLARVVQAARAGQAVMAVIEGPAGIGKSRLLARAREMAGAGGFRVLSARGSDLEREHLDLQDFLRTIAVLPRFRMRADWQRLPGVCPRGSRFGGKHSIAWRLLQPTAEVTGRAYGHA